MACAKEGMIFPLPSVLWMYTIAKVKSARTIMITFFIFHKSSLSEVYHIVRNSVDRHMNFPIVSSVMTADGIHDLTGFYIVCLVILIGDMARGVMFPSMWPLVSELGGTSVTLGYAVASFSINSLRLFSWAIINMILMLHTFKEPA